MTAEQKLKQAARKYATLVRKADSVPWIDAFDVSAKRYYQFHDALRHAEQNVLRAAIEYAEKSYEARKR